MRKSVLFITLLVFLSFNNVFAESIFDATIKIVSGPGTGDSYSKSFSSAEDCIDSVKGSNIKTYLPNYTDKSGVEGTFNYRGLPMYAKYVSNSTTLAVDIPAIGFSQQFTGNTRDESNDQFSDFLKKNGTDYISKINEYFAQNTAVDPITGNPSSLAGQMVSNSFSRGFTEKASLIQKPGEQIEEGDNGNLMGIAPSVGSFKYSDKYDLNSYSLPLSYTFRSNADARKQLTLSMPIQMLTVEDSKSYNLGFGAAYSIPVTGQLSNHQWILTPSLDYGLVGSVDLGSVGQIVQGALTSLYATWIDKYTISMGNMVGYYKSLKFKLGDYEIDPKVSNTVFRNAIMVAIPTDALLRRTMLELFIIDTRISGSSQKISGYDEIGFAFGLVKPRKLTVSQKASDLGSMKKDDTLSKAKNFLTSYKLGLTYLTSNDGKGVTVNFGYIF
ncbi:MAG: hypothetical protein HQK79_09030 [Desulfobacterales bacterium]|nr:hypothetical protein [Desulfobacterales bacterium]